MNYTDADLPVTIKHGESFTFNDGTAVRFESNGEAKDLFFGDEWTASVQLFPTSEHLATHGGTTYKLTALFEDGLTVEKV